MKVSILETGYFKLDGGAMFGVVPKTIWNKLNPSDENNLCTWSMRCLLIEDGEKKIVVDTGMGDKQDDRFRSHFHPHGNDTLLSSLKQHGVHPDEITDVFLTHLHFDHCGGAIQRVDGKLIPTFKNATYWSNEPHYKSAIDPNFREKASFLKENFVPLEELERLSFVPIIDDFPIFTNAKVRFVYGHTHAMMVLHIIDPRSNKELIYCADLMPSSYHVRMPYVMAYDIDPLQTLKDKKDFYNYCTQKDVILFFEHDPKYACGLLKQDSKGRYLMDTNVQFSDFA